MSGELRATPNLNQKSRLFDPPKSKVSAPAPARSNTSNKKETTPERTSASGGLAPGPNLNQKSRLFAPTPARSSTSTNPTSSPRSSQTNAATPSPRSSQSTPSAKLASPSSARSASPSPKAGAKDDSAQKAAAKKTATFSRIVICYCCGQGFSIHSVVKHYDKCRERRPANYKGLPKEATCPEMPEPNKLPVPGESSTAAEFQAFNDEAFQIYKAHLVQCPWGCGRTTEPDRTAVHMRGCTLRPKPPPKAEGEEEGENKADENVEGEPDSTVETSLGSDEQEGERVSTVEQGEDGEQEADGPEADGQEADGQGDIYGEEKQQEGEGEEAEADVESDVASTSQALPEGQDLSLSASVVGESTTE